MKQDGSLRLLYEQDYDQDDDNRYGLEDNVTCRRMHHEKKQWDSSSQGVRISWPVAMRELLL